MEGERLVAGLHCGEVLADLSAALDGRLTAERIRRIEDHVRDCEACKRFAGELTASVRALREALGEPPADPQAETRLLERLQERLREETQPHG